MPNRLQNENSRYLKQHANNPVDWYPWGEEAFEKAQRENKPVFLSIGYSACHWCHVMAHESFENKTTADLLNQHFVSIKVDREERPDLDRIYMNAVQAMTGGGGWPMSVFITPEGQPFYGGTYFPPEPRYNVPGFNQVLMGIIDAWKNQRDELLESGMQLIEMLDDEAMGQVISPNVKLKPQTITQAVKALRKQFDAEHGGWGGAPKFPQPMSLLFLLHRVAGGSVALLEMITPTLDAMAFSGLYDQIGGGFHRYSVDASWTVPHFEKMLYDNAQLARVYVEAWQLTGDDLYRVIAEETLNYVLREMTAPEGYFYATQDADSEGEEGKFFVWTPDEVLKVLGEQATHFLDLHGITQAGNFEGKTVLSFQGTREQRDVLAGERQLLRHAREKRIHPGRDEKLVTSWNGLMLTAFALAGRVLKRPDYLIAAQRCADFLLTNLRDAQGRLFHVWNKGSTSVSGMLDDYTHLAEGLLMLYETDFNPRWYIAAKLLADVLLAHFIADERMAEPGANKELVYAGFFDTADDAESLIIRPREMQDNAVPSGNAMAATVLLRLSRLSGDTGYETIARTSLASMSDMLGTYPLAFAQWLVALDAALAESIEVAILGDAGAADAQAMLDTVREVYHPHTVVAVGEGDVPSLMAKREQIDGKATIYVCKNHVCLPPVTDTTTLKNSLT